MTTNAILMGKRRVLARIGGTWVTGRLTQWVRDPGAPWVGLILHDSETSSRYDCVATGDVVDATACDDCVLWQARLRGWFARGGAVPPGYDEGVERRS